MRIAYIVYILIFFNTAYSDYYENKFVFKLVEDYNYNSQYHKALSSIDKNIKIDNLINTNILSQLNNKLDKNLDKKSNDLNKIYVAEFSYSIDILSLSNKLMNLPEIEYAEPLYKRNISYIPNDTLLYEQYYLINTYIYDAWKYIYDNNLADSLLNKEIIIGVTDTGIDFEHIELKNMIYNNPDEMGADDNGNDKRFNGIDDDNNGFVDDYQGWDFVSDSSSTGYDNNPKYGHPHGTHVAGIISAENNNTAGIAGIGINMKILPVKVSSDSYYSTSIENSYNGILYAAIMGADVINCSWGGTGFSQAEQDIINQATSLGSLIVAAAGNSAVIAPQYPASYDNVISVAATNFIDEKTSFTNYHSSVDISAPGYQIISTIPNNGYDTWNGTSMAAPIVSAIAGWAKRRFPELSPFQIGEILKSTSSKNKRNDDFYPGLLGAGIVNLFKVLSDSVFYSADIIDINLSNNNNENTYEYGDSLTLSLNLINYLGDLNNISIDIYEPNHLFLKFIDSSLNLDFIASGEVANFQEMIKFVVSDSSYIDQTVQLVIHLQSNEYSRYFSTNFIINPSYKDFTNGIISTTINSRGNIAFNDYPNNTQGIGFAYSNSKNLLFEGGFIAATPNKINDAARNERGSSQNKEFNIGKIIEKTFIEDAIRGETNFLNVADSNNIGITIHQSIVLPEKSSESNTIFIKYSAINESDDFLDSLYLGLYFDWDIGESGQSDKVYFEQDLFSALAHNTTKEKLPYCAVSLLSERDKINFYAIDNPGIDTNSFGVYDGFTDSEKWKAISSGIARVESSITDASFIISAGPIAIQSGDTATVVFAISAADDAQNLKEILRNIHRNSYFGELNNTIIKKFELLNIFPNPASGLLTIDINKNAVNHNFTISIYDLEGKLIKDVFTGNAKHLGLQRIITNIESISQGKYFISISSGNEIIESMPLLIIK